MPRLRTCVLPLLLSLSCSSSPPPGAPSEPSQAKPTPLSDTKPEPPPSSSAAAAAPKALVPIQFVEDDLEGAMAKARAEKKAVFVDAWAPWCHTCLSMRSYVLNEPALSTFADRMVFVALDTDRPSSAAFLERYKMSFWPTFFVLEPENGDVLGMLAGAASVREMRTFIEDALRVMDASAPPGDPLFSLAQASKARTANDHKKALALYNEILAKTPANWPRRDDALAGKLMALAGVGDPEGCARFGADEVDNIHGAALPADFASIVLTCAGKLAKSTTQEQARRKAIARLEALVASPPPESTVDDRADVLAMLASVKLELGDADAARVAHEKRIALMEKAAAEAKTPEIAATYDYGRAVSYVALGRGEEAVRMLEAREREMPKSYEPPARLASTLFKMGRFEAALAANGRALSLSYGPRRLGYLKLRSDIQAKLGDKKGQLETLREEVAGYEALTKGQRNEAGLADARRRLSEAEGQTSKGR